MAFSGWLKFGGSEVINIERTVTYIRSLVPALQVAPSLNCEEVLHQVLGDKPYVTPLDDNAPWYDPKVPESHGFAGFYPLSISGLDDDTRTANVTEGVFDGGFVSPARRKVREVRVAGLLVGENETCVDYGLFWLRQILDSDRRRAQIGRPNPSGSETMTGIPDLCGVDKGDVQFLSACPELGCGKHCGHLSGRETAHPVDLSKMVASNGSYQHVGSVWQFIPNGSGTLRTPYLPDSETCPVRYEWLVLGSQGSTVAAQGYRDGDLKTSSPMDLTYRRTNLATNPQWKTTAGTGVIRKNLAINPSLRTLCAPTVVQTNRVPNPRGATSTSGYVPYAGTGGTSALTAFPTGGPLPNAPSYVEEKWSVAQTAITNPAYISVGLNGDATYEIPVVAGEKVSASCYAMTSVAGQNLVLELIYFNSANAQIGGPVQAPAFTPTVGVWTYFGVTDPGVAPAGATKVRVLLVALTGALFGVNQWLRSSAWNLSRNQRLISPYFDGASNSKGGQVYAWTGTAHASPSTATGYMNLSRTNTAANPACINNLVGYAYEGGVATTVLRTDSTLNVGGRALTNYARTTWSTVPTDQTTMDVWYGRGAFADLTVQPGQRMIFSCYARTNVFDRTVMPSITYCSDAGIPLVQRVGTVPFAIGGTVFSRVSLFDPLGVPVGCTRATLRLVPYTGGTFIPGDYIDMTGTMGEITQDGVLGGYFDGSTTPTSVNDYEWASVGGSSMSYAYSTQQGDRVVARTNWFLNPEQNALYPSGVTSVNAALYPVTQDASLNRAQTTRSATTPSTVVSSVNIDGGPTPVATTPGDTWTLSCDVNTTADNRTYQAQVIFAPSGGGSIVTTAVPVAGSTVGPVRVAASAVAPGGATAVYLRVSVVTNSGNAPTGEVVSYDNVLFEKVAGARVYFSGDNIAPSNSGLAVQWEGAPHMSRSFAVGPCLNKTLQGVNNTPFWQSDNVSPAGGAVGSVFAIGDSSTGTDTSTATRTNFAKNPVARAASGTVEVRRNRILNPAGRGLTPTSTIVQQNRFINPKAGTNLTDWACTINPGGTVTATRMTDGTLVINGVPVTTYARLQVATVSTGAIASTGIAIGNNTLDGHITLVPGQVNTLSVWFRASTALRTYALVVTAHDGTGATVTGAVTGPVVTPIAGQWMQATVQITPTATGTRGYFRLYAQTGAIWTVGETLDATAALVQPVATLNPFFDGSFPSVAGVSAYAWTGTADASESTLGGAVIEVNRNYFPYPSFRDAPAATVAALRTNLLNNPRAEGALNWQSNNGAQWVNSLDTTVFHSGTKSLLSTPQAGAIGTLITILSTYNVGGNTPAVTPNRAYIASAWMRHNSTDAMQGGKVLISWLDSGGVAIGAAVQGAYATMAPNTWVRAFCTAVAPANAAFIRVVLSIDKAAGVFVKAGELAWADDAVAEEGQTLRPYFDGANNSAEINNYLTAAQSQPTVSTGWGGLTPTLVTAPWDPARKAMRVTGDGVNTAYTFSPGGSRALWEKGTTVTVSATVVAPAGVGFEPYVHNTVGNVYYGNVHNTTYVGTGLPQRVSTSWTFTADEPNGTGLGLAVLWNSGAGVVLVNGVQVFVGDVLIEEYLQARPYFEGTLGETVGWVGTADASASTLRAALTTGMTAAPSVTSGSSLTYKPSFVGYAGAPQSCTRVQSLGSTTYLAMRNSASTMTGASALSGGKRVYIRAKVRLDKWSGWPTLTTGNRGPSLTGRDDTNNDSTLLNSGPSGVYFPNPAAVADGFTWTEVFGAYDVVAGRNLEALIIGMASEGGIVIPAGIGMDVADVIISAVPHTFFDGASAPTTDRTYGWAGMPDKSASVWIGKQLTNWGVSPPGTFTQGIQIPTSTSTPGYGMDLRGGAIFFTGLPATPAAVGEYWAGRATVRYIPNGSWVPAGSLPAVRVVIHDGTGYVTAGGPNAGIWLLPTDGSPLTIDAVANAPLAATAQPRLYVYPYTQTTPGQVNAASNAVSVRVTEAIMSRVGGAYPLVAGWFDGLSTATPDPLTYSWSGAADASESISTGSKPILDTATSFPAVYRSTLYSQNVSAGEQSLVVMPAGNFDINRAVGDLTTNGHIPDAPTTISMYVHKDGSSAVPLPGQSVRLSLYSKPAGGSFTSQDFDRPAPVDGFISATATVPSGSGCAFWRITNLIGEVLYATEVLIENTLTAGVYFDGNVPDTGGVHYGWVGATDQSWSTISAVSRLLVQGAGDTAVSPANWYGAKIKVRMIGAAVDPLNTIHIEGHFYGGGEDYGIAAGPKDVVVTDQWQEICLPSYQLAPSLPNPTMTWDSVSPSTTWDSVPPSVTWDTFNGP